MTVIRRVHTVITGLGGGSAFNTLHFTNVTGNATAVKDAVLVFWTQLQDFVDNDATMTIDLEQQLVEDTTGAITAVEVATGANTVSGNSAVEAAPLATQGLIRLRTGAFPFGRELRGRIFIPGVTEGAGAGRPAAPYISGLNSAAAGLITNSASAGPLRVWSRPTPSRPGTSAVVTIAQTWGEYAVLRSRRD